MTWFEKLVDILQKRYYDDLVMGTFELIAIITGLLFVRKYKIGIYFLIYLIFDFVILISHYYLQIFTSWPNKERADFRDFSNVLISLIELLAYYIFFLNVIHDNTIIKLIK